ncbi:FAD-dependent oxidoreductase [Lichenicola sp.]|uniref:FAD-dependent oxidoreductase n=1 Tax=Lichenicola sp. TaxID=2804529 RepID=UPI003B008250
MQQVATLDSLIEGKPVTVKLGGTDILLLRQGGAVRAFSATCPHAGAPLDQGAVCEGRLVCPWHKAMFDITDGALLEPPALQPLKRYPVQVEGNAVMVSPEPIPPALVDPAAAPDDRTMVIVGAGAAGAAGVAALREFGYRGRIVMVGAEPGEPFDRTALSKFVLEGGMQPDAVDPLLPPDFLADHAIERLHDTVTGIDPEARTLTLAGGGTLSYSAVLLAPGGTPRPLKVSGADMPGVHVLRTRADAAAILERLHAAARPVVIVGGGFIGLEAASALRQQHVRVHVVMPKEVPFEPVLGREIGLMLRGMHEANGVVFHSGTAVAAIEGDPEHGVQAVRLENGQRLEAGLVLASVGIRPATGFAASLGPDEDGGLRTDPGMRVRDGVYAAGDVASFPFDDAVGGAGHIRVEHWRVAQQHARVAARNMLGGDARFEQAPFFWTYHYGKRIEVHGHPDGFDHVAIEGDLEGQDFVARLSRDGMLVGLIGCGRDTELASLALAVPAHG